MSKLPTVIMYTDGACKGNPGPGGYGVILKHKDQLKELSGGYRCTTNNRMELMAVIKGLEELKKPCLINLYSDSQYIVKAVTLDWAKNWQKNNWLLPSKKPAKNIDLWQKVLSLAQKHQINWFWLRGHGDNPDNKRCDRLAVLASNNGDSLPEDEGFKQSYPF